MQHRRFFGYVLYHAGSLKLMLCCLDLSCAGNDAEKIHNITDEIRKLEKGECWSSLPADFVFWQKASVVGKGGDIGQKTKN